MGSCVVTTEASRFGPLEQGASCVVTAGAPPFWPARRSLSMACLCSKVGPGCGERGVSFPEVGLLSRDTVFPRPLRVLRSRCRLSRPSRRRPCRLLLRRRVLLLLRRLASLRRESGSTGASGSAGAALGSAGARAGAALGSACAAPGAASSDSEESEEDSSVSFSPACNRIYRVWLLGLGFRV